MDNKQRYILRILKKYGILVIFGGELNRQNLPSPISGETIKQWISRALGDHVADVQVYMPYTPRGNTRLTTLANDSDMGFLKDILRQSQTMKDKELQVELGLAEEKLKAHAKKQRLTLNKKNEEEIKRTRENLSTIGTDTLYDILNSIDDLQPSVREFIRNFIGDEEAAIDTETLLTKLIEHHNNAAITVQELKAALT